jgi:hypothetical protein
MLFYITVLFFVFIFEMVLLFQLLLTALPSDSVWNEMKRKSILPKILDDLENHKSVSYWTSACQILCQAINQDPEWMISQFGVKDWLNAINNLYLPDESFYQDGSTKDTTLSENFHTSILRMLSRFCNNTYQNRKSQQVA